MICEDMLDETSIICFACISNEGDKLTFLESCTQA